MSSQAIFARAPIDKEKIKHTELTLDFCSFNPDSQRLQDSIFLYVICD